MSVHVTSGRQSRATGLTALCPLFLCGEDGTGVGNTVLNPTLRAISNLISVALTRYDGKTNGPRR